MSRLSRVLGSSGPVAILWDMDGTLVDTEPYWVAAEHALVEEAGGQWSDELAEQVIGNSLYATARFIRANSPVTLGPEEIVHDLMDRVIERIRDEIPWRPGARELLLEATAAGIPCALVTMSWTRLVEPVLEQLPDGVFATVASGDVVAHGKPHPEPYLHATRALQVAPGECLAIEDSPTGVQSSTTAGVPTLAVPHFVDIPPMPGALRLDSLDGVRVADLAALQERAAATF